MIKLSAVSKQYLYGARTLGAIDLDIGDGEVLALLGGVGSGRTTFLKTLAGVTQCEGEILFDGKPLDAKAANVAMLFDDLALFERKSGFYNVAYPLILRGEDGDAIKAKVEDAAARLGIVACLTEKTKKLSLLEKKKLALARLLVRKLDYIFVDDLTCGLSRADSDELWEVASSLFSELAKGGATVVYSTSDLNEAICISNRIAVFAGGQIMQVDTYQNIYDNPASVWAAQAVDKNYSFEKAELGLDDDGLFVRYLSDGYVQRFSGRVAKSYIGGYVLVGCHCDGYACGDRFENVASRVRLVDGYMNTTDSGRKVKTAEFATQVCVLPKKVALFDAENENCISSCN